MRTSNTPRTVLGTWRISERPATAERHVNAFADTPMQNPTLSLDGDVAATRLIIDEQDGPVLVGHSYGGAVITQAGNHEKVIALVYIAAFAPDGDWTPTACWRPADRRVGCTHSSADEGRPPCAPKV